LYYLESLISIKNEFYKSIILLFAYGIAESSKSSKIFAARLLRHQKFTGFTGFLPAGLGVYLIYR